MHYRWNFDRDNQDFLKFHFQTIYLEDSVAAADARMKLIQEQVNPAWGMLPETKALIESLHLATLKKMNAHFSDHPYLLGGKPCIGDLGMMAPMYGHLGRDPAPLSVMQTHAVRVFRWVERMNRPEPDMGEFAGRDEAYLEGDEVPDTLVEVLRHFAIDYVPETRAACRAINDWLRENPDLAPGTVAERGIGMGSFEIQGIALSTMAQPFRFYVLKRVQDEFEALGEQDRRDVADLLSACDMSEVLDLKLTRDMGRANNLEVWL